MLKIKRVESCHTMVQSPAPHLRCVFAAPVRVNCEIKPVSISIAIEEIWKIPREVSAALNTDQAYWT